ncbi:transposase IS116/IS110/IS902 family protein [Oxobacter pfennigii]|uniref:Transposase IS116/IS110/IS902 family protein n=1 Tax=Oxobacter pfennigii TaxID=36849 RepID=A0A0N8NSU0_9CLOT|nr:IS110 family transposase [Oxobacter pfennigii]KPU42968.1 transposase IS116/IS110/IS902 family protein [Oxobacter pfennigii]
MIAVGIDVSKSKSTIAILSSDGQILAKPFDVQHTEQSMNDLISQLRSYDDSVKILMEATGHYHLPVLKKFLETDMFVSVINPYLIKKYGDGEMRRSKTDKKDALRIATYVLEKSYSLVSFSSREQKYSDLKFLSAQYNQRISTKVKNRVYLGNILDETMPGIEKILNTNNQKPEKNLFFLFIRKYKSFDSIKAMGQKRFFNSYSKFAGKAGCRDYQAKCLRIYELASNSITTRGSDYYTVLAQEQCLDLVIQSHVAATEIITQMRSIAETLPEYSVLHSMHGVGDRLAPRIIAEIGDVRRFTSGKALNAYAGNDAPPYQSGQFESQNRHISKRGNPALRKVCYEVMQSLKMHKPQGDPVYLFIHKKEQEGKPLNVAKMAGVNKFLRIYYARVKELDK